MTRFCDFIWPTLENWEPSEESEIREGNRDEIDAIEKADWSNNPELALDEAHRLADAEEDRRRTTEGKATTYLLFAGALLPILTYLETSVWDGKVGTAPKLLSTPLLALAVAYLAWAGIWAFRTLKVGVFHQLDVTDLIGIWESKDPKTTLIKETLRTVRLNRAGINSKVSCNKMVQAFMVRTFVVFALLLITEASWEIRRAYFLQSNTAAPQSEERPPATSAPR